MSRVHDALRRAEQLLEANGNMVEDDVQPRSRRPEPIRFRSSYRTKRSVAEQAGPRSMFPGRTIRANAVARAEPKQLDVDWRNFLAHCRNIPFRPAPETHLIDLDVRMKCRQRNSAACAPA